MEQVGRKEFFKITFAVEVFNQVKLSILSLEQAIQKMLISSLLTIACTIIIFLITLESFFIIFAFIYYTILYYTILYYTILYYTILYYPTYILYKVVLLFWYFNALFDSVLTISLSRSRYNVLMWKDKNTSWWLR